MNAGIVCKSDERRGNRGMNRILVVEDEEAIANLIRMNLTNAGYMCDMAYDGITGADKLEQNHYDLCLFDIMLPGVNGYELLEYAKRLEIPVIFLTAKGEVTDKVKGLRAGADDYLTKPFEVLELLARVENVLRRFHKTEQHLQVKDLSIDMVSRTVKQNGRTIDLTLKEYELLLLFAQNKNVALYRETIYERVWDSPYLGDSRTIDLHIQRLRKKTGLEHDIEAVYKVGYRLKVEE